MYLRRLLERLPALVASLDDHATLQRALSSYFHAHREMGSRDRRSFRSLAYAFCRMGRALPSHDLTTRALTGVYLVGEMTWQVVTDDLTGFPGAVWKPSVELKERLKQVKEVYPDFNEQDLFPFGSRVSPQIGPDGFSLSMLVPPSVWIRIRSGHSFAVQQELIQQGIPFKVHDQLQSAIQVPAGHDLSVLSAYKSGHFEIQDLSSQLVGNAYDPVRGESWWDICAASGGKSLSLLEHCQEIKLLASDVRPAIVQNLKDRLKRTGHDHVRTAIHDVKESVMPDGSPFDAIIADVPCSGSGTWSRTPEQLTRFEPDTLSSRFIPLQKAVVEEASRHLKTGGRLFYSTCSVFSCENEEIVNWMVDTLGFRVVSTTYFSRYFDRADTLFLAVLAR